MAIKNRDYLSDKYLMRVAELFKKKGWSTIDNPENFDNREFDGFCERLAMLENDKQRDLMLDLTEDYLKIGLSDYEKYLLEIWTLFLNDNSELTNNNNQIHICPIMNKEDYSKIKSSTTLAYLCTSLNMRQNKCFSDNQIRVLSNPGIIKNFADNNLIKTIVLIDDYVGTGETALATLAEIKDFLDESVKIYVLSLVIQEEGYKNLIEHVSGIYYAIKRKKGISDRYIGDELKEKTKLMCQIEKKIKVDEKKWGFGFGKSEALISLIKTPNNTFPVYWYECKGSGMAPFPRKENIRVL